MGYIGKSSCLVMGKSKRWDKIKIGYLVMGRKGREMGEGRGTVLVMGRKGRDGVPKNSSTV